VLHVSPSVVSWTCYVFGVWPLPWLEECSPLTPLPVDALLLVLPSHFMLRGFYLPICHSLLKAFSPWVVLDGGKWWSPDVRLSVTASFKGDRHVW
jgi:hypothetical protein